MVAYLLAREKRENSSLEGLFLCSVGAFPTTSRNKVITEKGAVFSERKPPPFL